MGAGRPWDDPNNWPSEGNVHNGSGAPGPALRGGRGHGLGWSRGRRKRGGGGRVCRRQENQKEERLNCASTAQARIQVCLWREQSMAGIEADPGGTSWGQDLHLPSFDNPKAT